MNDVSTSRWLSGESNLWHCTLLSGHHAGKGHWLRLICQISLWDWALPNLSSGIPPVLSWDILKLLYLGKYDLLKILNIINNNLFLIFQQDDLTSLQLGGSSTYCFHPSGTKNVENKNSNIMSSNAFSLLQPKVDERKPPQPTMK